MFYGVVHFQMKYWAVLGRIFFALGVIGSGLMQLIRQDFVRLVPKLPAWAGSPFWWAILSGGVLVAAGAALAFDRNRRLFAAILSVLLVATFLLYIPGLVSNPGPGYMWTNPCKTLALLGGALLLAFSAAETTGVERSTPVTHGGRLWHVSAIFYGIFFVVGGIQHYVYLDFVTQLVPPWLPQRRVWACFTGVALIAGGLGINFRPTSRVAALASGFMVFLWVVMLHVPRALSTPADPGEISAVFEALALSGTAFLLAGTSRTH